ncbi:MAG: hypothetical protein GC168_00340 [Candidatus Hydrogenedens sp.]|nr:hypothetical protein [Candidatus Hydrogenedens sp.]
MFQILLLAGCIKLLVETERPLLCAALYAGFGLVFGLVFALTGDVGIAPLLVAAGMRFAVVSVYFLLLNSMGDGGLWWAVLVLGMAVLMFI